MFNLFKKKERSNVVVNNAPSNIAKQDNSGEKLENALREEILNHEKFKHEFVCSFDMLSLFYLQNKNYAYSSEYYIKKKINVNLYHYIILNMYKKIGDTTSISEIKNTLSSLTYVKQLMDETIYCDLRDWRNRKIPEHEIPGMLGNSVIIYLKYYVDEYIMKLLSNGEFENKIEEQLNEHIEHEDDYDWKAMRYFATVYAYAYSYIKALILFRNIENFSKNDELFKMYLNLKNNTSIDTVEISRKLYSIYKTYYSGIFTDVYNEYDFTAFMIIFNTHYNSTLQQPIFAYSNEINKFKAFVDSYGKEVIDFQTDDYDTILKEYEELLDKIDNKEFFTYRDSPYDLNYKYITGVYALLNGYILSKVGKHLPAPLFFEIFSDKQSGYIERLKNKQEKAEIAKERERLLKGDLSKEKAEEIDKLNYFNIATGYEFEEYLENIFQKLGYEVVLTKKSGDQGGDLVIEKDSEKLVVQAKYYSGSVGNKAVQEVVAAIPYYNAHGGIIVTNSTFTNSAKELAESNNILLIDGDELNSIRNSIINRIV